MALRALIGIATVIALLVFNAVVSPASAQECYGLDKFVEAVKSPETVIMIANSGASKKLVERVNMNRRNQNRPQIEGSLVVIGLIRDQTNNVQVGVAIFDPRGCVIPDTVAVVSLDQWAGFMTEAGVDVEDFAKLENL